MFELLLHLLVLFHIKEPKVNTKESNQRNNLGIAKQTDCYTPAILVFFGANFILKLPADSYSVT